MNEDTYRAQVKRRKRSLEVTVIGPNDDKTRVTINYGREDGLVGVQIVDPHELIELSEVR